MAAEKKMYTSEETLKLSDEEFFEAYSKGLIPRRADHFTEENFEQEMEEIPLFMTKAPTEEQIKNNPQLAALQGLIYDESTPEEKAKYHKDHGNDFFNKAKAESTNIKLKRSHLKQALLLYTQGIEENCSDKALQSVLFSNRAAVNLVLENHRQVILDCVEACKLDRSNVKAFWRAAQSCYALQRYAEAVSWCTRGLQHDNRNEHLLAELVKCNKAKATQEKKERMEAKAKRDKAAQEKALFETIKARGINVVSTKSGSEKEKEEPNDDDYDEKATAEQRRCIGALHASVHIDENKLLHFPAMFLYPEHQQSDLINDALESSCLRDHLEVMFPDDQPPVGWDVDAKYKASKLALYYETPTSGDKMKLCSVDPQLTVIQAITQKGYRVVDGVVSFFVLVRGSPFEKIFLERYKSQP